MKFSLSIVLSILLPLTFLGCNSNTSKALDANAHQQATSPSFPTIRIPNENVNCRNCYATFKLSRASQKQSNGHNYIECPICHKDYLSKAK